MTASPWTDDRIDRLKTLWLEGRTADQIARELAGGISRSAVLGKVHRLGLSAGRSGRPPSLKGPRQPPSAARPRATQTSRPSPGGRVGGAERALEPTETIAAPLAPLEGVTLLSVRRGQCRWPFGEPKGGALVLCGRPVARGAFCRGHATVGYRSPPGGAPSLLALAGLA